jgi:hypothetical protein
MEMRKKNNRSINEMRISAYNKEYGDMFYIPVGIKEYQERTWEKVEAG